MAEFRLDIYRRGCDPLPASRNSSRFLRCAARYASITSSSACAIKSWRCSKRATWSPPIRFRLRSLDWAIGPEVIGTPLGELEIADKIGDGAPAARFSRIDVGPAKSLRSMRRVAIRSSRASSGCAANEAQNANAFRRDIYIHGTPEERNIGRPASYGCIRMRSLDIINLYSQVGRGAQVTIVNAPLDAVIPDLRAAMASRIARDEITFARDDRCSRTLATPHHGSLPKMFARRFRAKAIPCPRRP